MKKVGKFEKVSFKQFNESVNNCNEKMYDQIKLPKRATIQSAGYDFFAPFDITINPKQTIKIPTGIRVKMLSDYVLLIFPRSSLGFKFRLQLDNTVGVVDSDYYYSDNEGHIFIKLTNDNNENKILNIKQGEAFAQGIFLNFGITEDDEVSETRNGGFGSTNKKV
ncbi:MAG: hypothetical protein K2J02_02235 [Malacoplasma sp.]|nr:hypothetical protein [Malacoplasma sp.]MDE7075169.1 hypothetical protein [Malacoplasma sp.]MDE7088165.1 hypothetical protein [Malacoplasma sp.]